MLFPRSHTIDSIFIVLLFKKPCLGERGRKIGAMRDERGRCRLAPEKGEDAQKREGAEKRGKGGGERLEGCLLGEGRHKHIFEGNIPRVAGKGHQKASGGKMALGLRHELSWT